MERFGHFFPDMGECRGVPPHSPIPHDGKPCITWNSLPDNLKSAASVHSFKHNIKTYFFKKLGHVEADIYSYA